MFSVGMYVACPIFKAGNVIYVLGKIKKYDESSDEVTVNFFDRNCINRDLDIIKNNQKTYYGDDVSRACPITPSTALWKNKLVNIICELNNNKNELKPYCCQYYDNGKSYIRRISESELNIDFYQIWNSAEREAFNFLNCKSDLFVTRQFLSERKRYIESLGNILSTLVNTRVNLYPHQIDAIIKATENAKTKVMLADEVGLGKTIEALTILKYYIQLNARFRCLIIAPESLEYQWLNETSERFEIESNVFSYNRVINKKEKDSAVIISYADYYRYRYELGEMQWDMVIVDEAHKILNSKYFPAILKVTRRVRNVILLSATPITHEGKEYLQLMKMLNPVKYGSMDVNRFGKLLELQKFLHEKLFEMSTDIEFYNQMDMSETFIMYLQEINEKIADPYFEKIIKGISAESSDKGLYAVKLALNYLRKQYVIETNIVRHRRIDIKEAQIKRILKSTEPYTMEGADLGIFESNLYNALLTLIGEKITKDNKLSWIRVLEGMHSSPYALWGEFLNMEIPGGEKKECFELLKKWKSYCDEEIEKIIKGNFQGRTRFGKLIEVINSCKARKILIFSSFTESVKHIYHLIQAVYGKKHVIMFNSEMSRLETQLAAKEFQNNEECRFIVCDGSGGEGRNFQKADLIIHFDLSWSPAMMEQRIGRLDRIGRDVDRDVESIVLYASDTIEETLFDLYNDSLRVFSRSLCGLEIIFEELRELIAESFAQDTMFGLSHAKTEIDKLVNKMEDSVEKEIYFSSSNEDSIKQQTYIREVSEAFDQSKEKESENKILSLLEYGGIISKINTDVGTVSIDFRNAETGVLQKNLFYDAFNLGKYEGTFKREYAVKHDSINYFSPNHIIYQTALSLVDKIQIGRFHAVSIADEELRWAGFILVWNVNINNDRLFKGGLNPQRYQFVKRYLNEQQVTTAFKICGEYEYNEIEIASLFHQSDNKAIYGMKDTVGYGMFYDEESWEKYLKGILRKAEPEAKKLVRSLVMQEELLDYLQKERIANDIEKRTVCYQDKNSSDKESALMASLLDCSLQIDSILYIEI